MDRRVDRKRRTKYAYGKRKRKPPPVGKTKQSAAIESDEPSTASPPSYVSSEADTCSLPMLGSEAYDAGPSTSRDVAVRPEVSFSLRRVTMRCRLFKVTVNRRLAVTLKTRGHQLAAASRCGVNARKVSFSRRRTTTWCQLSRMSAIVCLSGSAPFKYTWNLVSCSRKAPRSKPAVSAMHFARCRQRSGSSGSRSKRSKHRQQKRMSSP
ncbi:hypothetical protein HPB51_012611 [Rhipicephalus microplus]|uniref:Uncharacterized protein n=1 Tax=Rhipicephalus microplus TaxID=6941 RepID=A0A9J6E1J5_RHIMP|nr:hypothetical protein HPB51_012611 [Rhipicephalus microplus]